MPTAREKSLNCERIRRFKLAHLGEYIGKVCAKHPELKGKRRNGQCAECNRARDKARVRVYRRGWYFGQICNLHPELNGKRRNGTCPKCKQARDKSAEGKYSSYKCAAKKRNIIFELPLEAFAKIAAAACLYCGETPAGGCDRIGNEKFYRVENSVPCCTRCNKAKMEMPHLEFLAHCFKIANHYDAKITAALAAQENK